MTAPTGSSSDAEPDEALHISISLPGSASLGAFQAGAIAAVDVMRRTLIAAGREVRVDAIGGASAGSIVGLVFAHCLTTGRDCGGLLREAWIEDVDVDLLSGGGARAPLGFDDLESKVRDFLSSEKDHPYGVHDPVKHPVGLQIGLTVLQGFTREVGTLDSSSISLDYSDHVAFHLEAATDADQVLEPEGRSALSAALTSATHPGAFAPRLLDRSADRERLLSDGVTNFPAHGMLWYTDGGLVESQPVGRVLSMAREVSGPIHGERLHLVVDPRSSAASGHEHWSDPDDPKDWVEGLRRALSILPTQSLHDDLRRVAAMNDRISAVNALCERLRDSDIDGESVCRELHAAAGTAGKELATIEMITPLLIADDDTDEINNAGAGVGDLLAGDFIGAFGGFLNRRVRRSDYLLGWRSTREWVVSNLGDHGCSPTMVDAVVTALDEERDATWSEERTGADGADQLDASDRWQLTKLAVRAGGHLVRSAMPPLTSPRLSSFLPFTSKETP